MNVFDTITSTNGLMKDFLRELRVNKLRQAFFSQIFSPGFCSRFFFPVFFSQIFVPDFFFHLFFPRFFFSRFIFPDFFSRFKKKEFQATNERMYFDNFMVRRSHLLILSIPADDNQTLYEVYSSIELSS